LKAISKLGWLAYATAVVAVILDQASKHWIMHGLELASLGTVPVFGPLQLTWLENRGVSFGLFHSEASTTRWILTSFALIVAAAIAFMARNAQRPLVALAFGLMVGGAVGNAIDRMRFGAVIDFIDLQKLFFPWVFNIADSALTVGVILLLVDMATDKPRQQRVV
jgi:signal peptidase II